MTSPLPLRPSIDHTPSRYAVIDLADDEAAEVLDAIGSETARSLLEVLDQEPMTASDLAGHVDTSLQNVQYHLQRLRDAGVISVVGTWYSSRGREMNVYALASERLELCISSGPEESQPTEQIDAVSARAGTSPRSTPPTANVQPTD